MKKVLCLLVALCLIFLVGCEYRVVMNDGEYEKVVADDGTVYYYTEMSRACCYGVALDKLKSNVVAEIEYDEDIYEYFSLSDDGNIGVLHSGGLAKHPFLFVKEGYDMPDLTTPERIEALYYIPCSMYNLNREERNSDENYYENYRLPIEQSDAIEFSKGLSQYIATDTTGYYYNNGRYYYGYIIIKFTDIDLYFHYIMWSSENSDIIQIQEVTYNEDLEMYDYYNVPIEYLSFIPLVKEETRE